MYSLGVILKFWNEELLLPLCLSQLNYLHAHRLYLCDDGSKDSSPEIAKDYIINHPNATYLQLEAPRSIYFGESKAEAVKINDLLETAFKDGCDWVLCIDADEMLTFPLLDFIINYVLDTVPRYGIYIPILDMIQDLDHFIIYNHDSAFAHYPCPHLKIFGKDSGWRRTVDGMNLDQGVTGSDIYIMGSRPYMHLRYLFKHRRSARGEALCSPNHRSIIPKKVNAGCLEKAVILPEVQKWWENWIEPDHTW